MLLVPQVHAGFVAYFDIGIHIGEQFCRRTNHTVLRVVAQIAGVEVEQVVVLDSGAEITAVDVIPDGLEEPTRRQVLLCQSQLRRPIHDRCDHWIGQGDLEKSFTHALQPLI